MLEWAATIAATPSTSWAYKPCLCLQCLSPSSFNDFAMAHFQLPNTTYRPEFKALKFRHCSLVRDHKTGYAGVELVLKMQNDFVADSGRGRRAGRHRHILSCIQLSGSGRNLSPANQGEPTGLETPRIDLATAQLVE